MPRKRKHRYIDWGGSTPRQLIKAVWGLGAKEPCIDLTLIHDNTLLMDMDAPDAIPAGSMFREETPSGEVTYFAARSSHVLRPGR